MSKNTGEAKTFARVNTPSAHQSGAEGLSDAVKIGLPLVLLMGGAAGCAPGAAPIQAAETQVPPQPTGVQIKPTDAQTQPTEAPSPLPVASNTPIVETPTVPVLPTEVPPTETPAPTATPTFEQWVQTNQPDANSLNRLTLTYAKSLGVAAESVQTRIEMHTGVDGPFAVLVDSNTGYPIMIATDNEMNWKEATLANIASERGLHFGALLNLNRDFRDITIKNFNFGNAYIDWNLVQAQKGVWNFDDPGYNVDTAYKNGITDIHANLIWTRNIADWAINDPDFHGVMVDYITNVMNHYKGRISNWSVYNEAKRDAGDIFWNKLGMQGVRDAYATARAVDPNAKLWYNDYVDLDGTIPDDRMPIIEDVVGTVQKDGNIDGIALQVITRASTFDPNKLEAALTRLDKFGLPIHIEEFSVLINGENTPQNMAKQAEVAAQVIEILRNHPNVQTVVAFPLEDRIANMIYNEIANSGLWAKQADGSYVPKPLVYSMMGALAADK